MPLARPPGSSLTFHAQSDIEAEVAQHRVRMNSSGSVLSPDPERRPVAQGKAEEARAAVRSSPFGHSARVSIAPAALRHVYVMRHGLKETNNPSRDNLELPLTTEGLGGLTALRACLDARGIRFDAVLTSPFRRCLDTAAALQPS